MELHTFLSSQFILLKNNCDMEIFPVTTIWRRVELWRASTGKIV